MKKLLYTFLAVSIIFSACEEEDAAPTNTNNNNNNNTGNSSSLVGVWHFQGHYDLSGDLDSSIYFNEEDYACALMGYIEIHENGFGTYVEYGLDNDISGPCNIKEVSEFQYEYVNSSTLEFSFINYPDPVIAELISPTQLQIYILASSAMEFNLLFELFQ
jgi:hypothetical protein